MTSEILVANICAFTETGKNLVKRISSLADKMILLEKNPDENLKQWVKETFEMRRPLIFVGAAGIAVRFIAPFVADKFSDSAVLVIDEKGRFVIPVLSGHLGGANQIAEMIAEKIGAQAVITTATDINETFSVDLFAKKNSLRITDRSGIKKISSRILAGEKIRIWADEKFFSCGENIPSCIEFLMSEKMPESADVILTDKKIPDGEKKFILQLVPKTFCVGMGCKKGKEFLELKNFLEKILSENAHVIGSENPLENIRSISSIDLKKNETGLLTLANYFHVPFEIFSAEELSSAKGNFSSSDFVGKITGVSNVCERAAALDAESENLIVKKICSDGMTMAVAEKKFPVRLEFNLKKNGVK